jgi:HD-GYP domain-containing protein (c-di-GMP phosphodiesterase class II)
MAAFSLVWRRRRVRIDCVIACHRPASAVFFAHRTLRRPMSTSIAGYSHIADRELLLEFRDALNDQVTTLERQVANLRREPGDRDSVATLFRALHTIKGDASICRFELGVRITHPIESLLVRLREGKLVFSALLAEAILLALDRLELAVDALLAGRSIDSLRLAELIDGLDGLSTTENAGLDASSIDLIEAVTGFRPAGAAAKLTPKATARRQDNADDLRFFQRLALQLETYSPLFKGRSGRLLRLALETNARAGKPVDVAQLEAAVYLHDIGMMFLPESIWLKVGPLTDAERRVMHEHPSFAAGLAERMAGWQEAATMIAQHHEMVDGQGYPQGLAEDQIVPGARILAIVDAFEAVTLKHSHRGQGRSLLRAVAEINASDRQFSAEWIGHFNQVIRGMVEA